MIPIEKNQISKEPSDTALHQQRMRAWNPVLDPIAVAITFLAISAIFIPVGKHTDSHSQTIIAISTISEFMILRLAYNQELRLLQ
jgi:hypothetical protein